MAALEGTYKSLLQGVSQQVPRLRLDGQVTTQDNMLSDPVTSVRRRPGTPLHATYDFGTVTSTNLYTEYLERGSDGRNLVINTDSGNWWLLSKDATTVVSSGTDSYFVTTNGASSIQTTSVGGETFILNIEMKPVTSTSSSKKDPDTTGWYFTKTAGFSKAYTLSVSIGGNITTVTYTTPAGTADGDVDKSTPIYITTQLYTQLVAKGITVTQQDMYLYITGSSPVVVSSTSGTSYVGYSGNHNVSLITDLPAVLPSNADGTMMSVGTDANALAWYRWSTSDAGWTEDSSYDSPTAITNMPRVLSALDAMTSPDFEGRLSGDSITNELPTFLENGAITGMTTYQGRLALLSGAFVTMSKSGNPYRFFRSTVTELLNGDRIDIGIGSSQNSVLRRGIQFNRDLVLFGDSIQAVVSGSGAILTPSTAAISLTSEESCTSKIAPMQAGQTVMYPFKRSGGYSGMLELIPSQYTSSQYVSQDAAGHLPEYFAGEVRFTTASNVVNMCAFAGDTNLKELYIYEYMWSSEGKQQSAWHRWTTALSIASSHFAREQLIVFMYSGGSTYITSIDPREGYDNQTKVNLPYIDLYSSVNVSSGSFTVPPQLVQAVAAGAELVLSTATGTAITEEVGLDSYTGTSTAKVVRGVADGTYWAGVRFNSVFTPTPPVLKDQNDKEIGSGHVRLVRLEVALRNTGVFTVNVVDPRTDVNSVCNYTGLFLNSTELEPDYPMFATSGNVIVPCRTMADTTEAAFSTSGTHDMNFLDITYTLRYNQRRRRV